jgi:phosphoribosylanthranilate isomerase
MMRAKVCGLTRLEDAECAVAAGAWAVGFIFYDKSPRAVSPRTAGSIVKLLPPHVLTVGVFVNASRAEVDQVRKIAGLRALQFHGDETPEFCAGWGVPVMKAVRPRSPEEVSHLSSYKGLEAILVDAAAPAGVWGGTGKLSNWESAIEAKTWGNVVLSGGLTPENVASAVQSVRPWAVDVSSGVESAPGQKDPQKIEAFFRALRGVGE